MSERPAARIRLLLALDRALGLVTALESRMRDEMLWAWTTPEQRDAITRAIFARQAEYREGGQVFAQGLFAWEERVFRSPLIPPAGRALVGGAGGGREIAALVERGFEVTAFEPSSLVTDAQNVASRVGHATVVQASYDDFVGSVAGREGALCLALAGARFDFVLLGWGSLNHVHAEADREALLRAIRTLAPAAPVLASYVARGGGRIERSRDLVRAVLRRRETEEGVQRVFMPHAGFATLFDATVLPRLAERTGYRVALFDPREFPHAVLVPAGVGDASGTTDATLR